MHAIVVKVTIKNVEGAQALLEGRSCGYWS
jgi:hypothetical protein